MQWAKKQTGFTIVELLIVVVVIAILAAITIVAFNGIQSRANESAIQSELAQNSKKLMGITQTTATGRYSTIDVMPGGVAAPVFDNAKFKVVSYCTNGSDFIFAVQTKADKKYYVRTSATMVNDNAMDAYSPCQHFGIGSSQLTYVNLPASCAVENTSCSFTGTATVVYGSAAQGRFARLLNQTSPVTCNNATFTDPATGYEKRCYVYPN